MGAGASAQELQNLGRVGGTVLWGFGEASEAAALSSSSRLPAGILPSPTTERAVANRIPTRVADWLEDDVIPLRGVPVRN